MSFPATERLRAWYEAEEVHFAVARTGGEVRVGIAPQARFVDTEHLALALPEPVWDFLREVLADNSWIALHPGGLGAVKAPYQLKGLARRMDEAQTAAIFPEQAGLVGLLVSLRELYITKPGPEAGLRVDHWSRERLTDFERSLGWLEEQAPCSPTSI